MPSQSSRHQELKVSHIFWVVSNVATLWIAIKLTLFFFCIQLYLLLVWAVTSEQMKIKSKLFLRVLGVTHWCDLRHNQLSKRKFSSILQCAQFLNIFQKIVYSKIAWVVAIIVSSQIKTYSAYSLCTRSTFSIALLGHFWLFILSWF